MKKAVVSTLRMGELVKLTPQGKTYRIHTLTRQNGKLRVELRDRKGKPKSIGYAAIVYYNPQSVDLDSHAWDIAERGLTPEQ